VIGFASLTVPLIILRIARVSLRRPAWPPDRQVRSALGSALSLSPSGGFLLSRIPALHLDHGIGFGLAALVTSLLMGGAHYFNPGGHGPGPLSAIEYCLVTCLVIRRTGGLWMALGIHSAWSWGEVLFYSALSSGLTAQGHLLNASIHGPA